MKIISAKSLVLVTALLCSLAVAGRAQQTSATNFWLLAGAPVEGSWRVSVQLKDCNSGDPIGDPFQSLVSLIRGGVQVETTANSNFYPAERGPGHGNWTVLGPRTYN